MYERGEASSCLLSIGLRILLIEWTQTIHVVVEWCKRTVHATQKTKELKGRLVRAKNPGAQLAPFEWLLHEDLVFKSCQMLSNWRANINLLGCLDRSLSQRCKSCVEWEWSSFLENGSACVFSLSLSLSRSKIPFHPLCTDDKMLAGFILANY